MKASKRIDDLMNLNNPSKIQELKKKYKKFTYKALKPAKQADGLSEKNLLRIRDTVFWELVLKAIENKENEMGIIITPKDKNAIINKIAKIIKSE
jgi:hypothetical protein